MDLNKNCEGILEIPQDLLIEKTDSPLLSLVQFVYPQIFLDMMSLSFSMLEQYFVLQLNMLSKLMISFYL